MNKCGKVCDFSVSDRKMAHKEAQEGGQEGLGSDSNNMKGLKGTPGGPKGRPERFSGAVQVRNRPKVWESMSKSKGSQNSVLKPCTACRRESHLGARWCWRSSAVQVF